MIETLILILVIIILFLIVTDKSEFFNNNDVLFNEINKCQDNNDALKAASGGMCSDCQQARELYDKLGKKYSDDLGFGSLYTFCPVTLGALNQSCLQKILNKTENHLSQNDSNINSLIQDIGAFKINPNTSYVDKLANNIDNKINQDYVKLFLDYHQKTVNDTHKYRHSADGTLNSIDKNFRLNDLKNNLSTKNQEDLPQQNITHLAVYSGNYTFDISQIISEIANHNIILTEKDKDDLSAAVINISKANINVSIGDQIIQTFVYNHIAETVNPFSSILRAFKLANNTENIEIYPTSNNAIYLNVINSDNTNQLGLLTGIKYALIRL